MEGNHYDILGITRQSTMDQVKESYRKLALKVHPDLNPDPGAGERFGKLYKAYRCLSDPDARAAYDTFLDRPTEAVIAEVQEEIRQKKAHTGSDRYSELLVGKRIKQKHVKISFTRWDGCRRCQGTGEIKNGRACPACLGMGQVIGHREVALHIQPKSLKDGTLRLAEEGDVGVNGGPRGDLVISIITPQNTYAGLIAPAIIAALLFLVIFGLMIVGIMSGG